MKKPGYRQFIDSLRTLIAKFPAELPSGLVVLWGPSSYFIDRSLQALVRTWSKQSTVGEKCEYSADSLGDEFFLKFHQSRGMFSGQTLFILTGAQKAKSLSQNLKKIESAPAQGNLIIITCESDKLPAKLEKELKRLNYFGISCFPPSANELPRFIHSLAWKYKVEMSESAVSFMGQLVGSDYYGIENEMRKLSLIFNEGKKRIEPQDLRKYTTLQREDHIFEVAHLLNLREFDKAHTLVFGLLHRGENVHAMLAILARYCRNAIWIKQGLNEDSRKYIRMPQFVIRQYQAAMPRYSMETLRKALTKCQFYDSALKLSSSRNPNLALSDVIDTLRA